MMQNVSESLEVPRLKLLRCASSQGDLQAWATFQQGLEETVLIWLHEHTDSQVACCLHDERHFVAQAFEQLQQAVFQGQVSCETLSEVLGYLRASLNGAILETLRVSSHPGADFEILANWTRLSRGERDLGLATSTTFQSSGTATRLSALSLWA